MNAGRNLDVTPIMVEREWSRSKTDMFKSRISEG